MPEAPLIRGRSASQRSAGSSAGALPALRVRYYKRMRQNKVYPVVVGWKSRKGGGDSTPTQVRLIMAGAQVVPSEHTLDPSDPDAKVTFYVTPLAKGWLRGERAEVLQNGRKVGELRLPAKVNSQRLTLLLLVLTFLLPWLLNQFFTHRLVEDVDPPKMTTQETSRLQELNDKLEKEPNELTDEEKATLKKLDSKDKETANKRTLRDGEVLAHRIRSVSPEIFPQVEEYGGKEAAGRVTDLPDVLGSFYTIAYLEYAKYHIPYYTFWVLLLLTLLSYVRHREKRKTRTGKPIEVGGD